MKIRKCRDVLHTHKHRLQMKKLMTIKDAFDLPDGRAVVSGVNPEFDANDHASIKGSIGDRVHIATLDGDFVCFVAEVGVTESLVGKKNIFIFLREGDSSHLPRGSEVFIFEG